VSPSGGRRLRTTDDTIRFYALRMREARCIQSSLRKIIVDGTDWYFLADDEKVRDNVLRRNCHISPI
jgi:hypothetical protein